MTIIAGAISKLNRHTTSNNPNLTTIAPSRSTIQTKVAGNLHKSLITVWMTNTKTIRNLLNSRFIESLYRNWTQISANDIWQGITKDKTHIGKVLQCQCFLGSPGLQSTYKCQYKITTQRDYCPPPVCPRNLYNYTEPSGLKRVFVFKTVPW